MIYLLIREWILFFLHQQEFYFLLKRFYVTIAIYQTTGKLVMGMKERRNGGMTGYGVASSIPHDRFELFVGFLYTFEIVVDISKV